MANGHGGKRQGAGRKPGSKSRATKQAKATLSKLAQALAPEALETLAEIMKDVEAPAAARVSAANAILDRGYGRPVQTDEGDDAPDAPALTINFNSTAPVKTPRVTRTDD